MPDVTFPAPAAAYRADLHGLTEPLGAHDDRWLAAASELHLAAGAAGTAREEHFAAAVRIATSLLGADRIEAFVRREWLGERSRLDPLIVLADTMYYERARHLGAVVLDDLLRAAPDVTDLGRGRILVRRTRIAWSLGALDEAADRYEFLGRLGRRARSAELLAQAEFGHMTLAQFRGDIPEVRTRVPRALALAEESRNPALIHVALLAAMMSDASEGKFDQAVMAGWRCYRHAKGQPIWETEALINLGQLMFEMGRPDRARAAFAAAVELAAPARLLLSALGGLAVASARAGQEPTVEWTVREVWRAQAHSVQPYPVATAHLECAVALRTLGRMADAERHRRAAEELARTHRFHEIAFRAAELEVASAPHEPAPLAPEAEGVIGQLAALEPELLPSALAFDSAPV